MSSPREGVSFDLRNGSLDGAFNWNWIFVRAQTQLHSAIGWQSCQRKTQPQLIDARKRHNIQFKQLVSAALSFRNRFIDRLAGWRNNRHCASRANTIWPRCHICTYIDDVRWWIDYVTLQDMLRIMAFEWHMLQYSRMKCDWLPNYPKICSTHLHFAPHMCLHVAPPWWRACFVETDVSCEFSKEEKEHESVSLLLCRLSKTCSECWCWWWWVSAGFRSHEVLTKYSSKAQCRWRTCTLQCNMFDGWFRWISNCKCASKNKWQALGNGYNTRLLRIRNIKYTKQMEWIMGERPLWNEIPP